MITASWNLHHKVDHIIYELNPTLALSMSFLLNQYHNITSWSIFETNQILCNKKIHNVILITKKTFVGHIFSMAPIPATLVWEFPLLFRFLGEQHLATNVRLFPTTHLRCERRKGWKWRKWHWEWSTIFVYDLWLQIGLKPFPISTFQVEWVIIIQRSMSPWVTFLHAIILAENLDLDHCDLMVGCLLK